MFATRRSAHILFALGVWPLLTVVGTAITLLNNPYVGISDGMALQAAAAGVALRLPDMLLSGAIVFCLSGFIFGRFGPETRGRQFGFGRLLLEPSLAFVAIVGGAAMTYPAVLSLPLLLAISRLPAVAAIALLLSLVIAGACIAAARGKRMQLAAALLALGILSPAPLTVRASLERLFGRPAEIVLLGLDSLSHHDHIEPLEAWTEARGGTWYEHPVAPGLLTNAVWTSILTMKPVSAHRIFHTFQRPVESPALLTAARAKGYFTVAIFPDQVTSSVGSRSGFDEDRSGAIGWRQVLLPAVANNAILIPIVRPAFPRTWPLTSPPNQAGTFTYDVRWEIRGILRAGAPGRRTFVASHLTYTHLAAYPRSFDLSRSELRGVMRAPGRLIADRSFDWQDTDRPTDPIPLQQWKLNFLQRVIQEEVESAHYLENGRTLIVFSDHGHRLGLSEYTFQDERYHRVLLATFGLPARCPREPISLIDVGVLLGFSDTDADPVVEFAIAPSDIWPALMKSAKLSFDGDVDLDPALLDKVFAGLLRHRPAGSTGASVCVAASGHTSR
ncbi:MAG TPA: hypothetical protein VFZ51_05325 [Woeseiaceae bacterium]